MSLKEKGAATELKFIYNSMSRSNLIQGIRERDEFQEKLREIESKNDIEK